MTYSDESYNLRIELATKGCELSAPELEKMQGDLDSLSRVTKDFPVSDLHITVIYHHRSHDYHVKTSLVLTKKTLFTGDRDVLVHPAYERCIRKLVKKVVAYKDRMAQGDERSKLEVGTHHDVLPTREPDAAVLEQTVQDADYSAFRAATDGYDEPIRKRIGRWIQRYPALEAALDDALTIDDIVEEVFLNAFERFSSRPEAVPLGEWLDQLIDPSIKDLLKNPDEELENINFARTLRETDSSEEPS